MLQNRRTRILLIIAAAIVVILTVGGVIVAKLPGSASNFDLNARLSEIAGVVQVQDNAQGNFTSVNNGFILNAIMKLQTEQQSKVRLDLSTGSIIRLGQNTLFALESPAGSTRTVLSNIELQVGKVWIVLKGGSLEVDTPRGIASVRGSYMSVWVQKNTNDIIVCCLEGSCTYKNDGGTVNLTTGQKIISSDTSVKPAVQPMDQGDMQDWQDNSPESVAVVEQVAPLAVTSTPTVVSTPVATFTPTLQSSNSPNSTLMPGAILSPYTTPGVLTSPYPTEYAGFDPALVEKCLSYGYTSEKMVTCLINLSLTLTP